MEASVDEALNKFKPTVIDRVVDLVQVAQREVMMSQQAQQIKHGTMPPVDPLAEKPRSRPRIEEALPTGEQGLIDDQGSMLENPWLSTFVSGGEQGSPFWDSFVEPVEFNPFQNDPCAFISDG